MELSWLGRVTPGAEAVDEMYTWIKYKGIIKELSPKGVRFLRMFSCIGKPRETWQSALLAGLKG